MSSVTGFCGTCAVALRQFTVEGVPLESPGTLTLGMTVRWQGQAMRLDGGALALLLDRPQVPPEDRGRVRLRLNRLGLAPDLLAAEDEPDPCPPESFTLTDGHRIYPARLVSSATGVLAVFDPVLPMPETELWVSALDLAPAPPRGAAALCGLMAGTLIDTPSGPRMIEELRPGDPVMTRDHGALPLVWRGETVLSGAELYLYPHLRPFRLREAVLGHGPARDLLAAPGLAVLLDGTDGLFGTDEVLARVADLDDRPGIRRDFSAGVVRYIHLMLSRPSLIQAEGVPVATFHPAQADAAALRHHARSLERAWPGLTGRPEHYGPPVRRLLTAGEAAIALSRV